MAHPHAGAAKASAKSKLAGFKAEGKSGIANGRPFYGSKVITSDSKTRDGEDVSIPDRKSGGRLDKKPRVARKAGGRVEKADGGGNWIAGATKNKGALHRSLGVPEGEKIPAKKLAKATHSDNPKVAKRARVAETLKSLHKAKGGAVKRAAGGKTPDADDDMPKGVRGQASGTTGRGGDITGTGSSGPGGDLDLPRAVRDVGNTPSSRSFSEGITPGSKKALQGDYKRGGAVKRAKGGRAGKSTKINIMISPNGGQGQQPQATPVPVPVPVGGGAPPAPPPGPMMPPPGMMPPGGPGGPPPGVMRKKGGRVGKAWGGGTSWPVWNGPTGAMPGVIHGPGGGGTAGGGANVWNTGGGGTAGGAGVGMGPSGIGAMPGIGAVTPGGGAIAAPAPVGGGAVGGGTAGGGAATVGGFGGGSAPSGYPMTTNVGGGMPFGGNPSGGTGAMPGLTRKDGGRVERPHKGKITAGAKSGEGRLEKAELQKKVDRK